MEIQLTALSPDGSGSPVHLALRTPADCTAGQLWGPLCEATGHDAAGPARLFVDGDAISVDASLGAPPLLDGAVLSLGTPGMTSPRRVAGVLELHVIAGPDSGQVLRLAPGAHLIGRAAEAGLRLADPDISRVHSQLLVTSGGVTVSDLGSTNGTWVDGSRAGADPVPLVGTSRLVVGSSTLVLRPPAALPAAVRALGAGQVAVNRSPRILPPVQAREIQLPARPDRREGLRLPMLAMLLPLVLSVAMAKVLNSPTYLLFGLMSPVMMLGSWFSDRRGGKHGHARRQAEYEHGVAAARQLIDDALREEGIRRRARLPDNAFLMTTVSGPSSRLWERRRRDDDVLHLRLGSSRLPSSVTVRDPDADATSTTPEIDDVPVCVPLPEVGVLGIAGERDRLTGLTRALLAQICGWHSPRDVSLHILTADPTLAADWTWTAYLPHTRPNRPGDCRNFVGILTTDGEQLRRRVAYLSSLVHARKAAKNKACESAGWRAERAVVLLDGVQRLRAVPGVSQLLEDGPGVGIYFICLDTDLARLPVEAHGTIDIEGTVRTTLRVELVNVPVVDHVVTDLVSPRWAERFARCLAPLRDATPGEDEGQVPDTARLLDLLDVDATDAAHLCEHWRARPRSTRATIGLAATGPYAVDLRRDGPHALVGGTTGSGKSELLQTLIASLALGNRPDEMNFVLIDYKGGSAFKDCARLPHTVGLVTDLDAHLTRRALTSLEAELKRRERILNALGAKDIDDYHASAGPHETPLPRLVLVIDEYKMLVEDLPGFVDGLVKIAAVGRSLGVHLILATQRPGGIVSSDIKANVNLRIALRVRDRADSEDIIEAPDAATVAESTPGRAFLRSGGNPLVMLQSARVAGHDEDDASPEIETQVLSWAAAGDPPRHALPPERATGPTDLARIVDATAQAAGSIGIPDPASPWLPPLPDVVATADLGAGAGWEVPYGLVDLPDEQAQRPLTWDLERDGHLAFAGTARTGRTSVLRTIAGGIARRFSPADVHLYAFDGSAGGLMPLTALPHTGAVVTRDQPARADRLLHRLWEEVSRRQSWLSERGLACLAEQRMRATADEAAMPYLVLLIDGWEGLTTALDGVDHGRPGDTLLQILREGAACGVRAAVTGDRCVLLSRVASVVPDKLVLRMADTTDLLMAGISSRSVPVHMPAGRALRTSDGAEVQLGLLSADVAGPAQVAALAEIGRAARADHSEVPLRLRPLRVEALPGRIAANCLAPHALGVSRSPTWALVGVGGDDLSPVGIELAHRGGGVLVAGPPGSGRSTTLATMARSLAQRGRAVAVVTARRSPLRELADSPEVVGCCTASDGARLRDLLTQYPDLVAFADDAELLLSSAAEEVLLDMVSGGEDTGGAVVCAGTSSELARLYRGITVEVRKRQVGVLLNPNGYADGELFGIRVSKGDDLRPGRGLLVDRSQVMPVQVAIPN